MGSLKRDRLNLAIIGHSEMMTALCDNLGPRFPRTFVKEVVAQYLNLVAYSLATGRPIRLKDIGMVQVKIKRPTTAEDSRPRAFDITSDFVLSNVGKIKVRRILKQINYVVLPKNRDKKIELIPKRWLL